MPIWYTTKKCLPYLHDAPAIVDVEAELADIKDAVVVARSVRTNAWFALLSRRNLPQLFTITAVMVFNQLDGINAVMFYAPQLFSALGSSQREALQTHVIIGVVNVVTTLVASAAAWQSSHTCSPKAGNTAHCLHSLNVHQRNQRELKLLSYNLY
jgi:Sugar (and other) transporter